MIIWQLIVSLKGVPRARQGQSSSVLWPHLSTIYLQTLSAYQVSPKIFERSIKIQKKIKIMVSEMQNFDQTYGAQFRYLASTNILNV